MRFVAGTEKAIMDEIQKRRSEKKKKTIVSESGVKGKRSAAVMQREKMKDMITRKKPAPKPPRKVSQGFSTLKVCGCSAC